MAVNGKLPGIVQWFPFGNYQLLENVIKLMKELEIKDLRTCISWADWDRPGGKEWFDILFCKLRAARIRIYPSLFYTPQRCAVLPPGVPREKALTAYPPADPDDFAKFVEDVVREHGLAFEWMMLWNEPNNLAYWRADLDREYIFHRMMLKATDVLKKFHKKILIGSLIPPYAPWLEQMKQNGLLERADAIGIHDFPGTWNDDKRPWKGWKSTLQEVRSILKQGQEVWITETGFSTRSLEFPDSPHIEWVKEKQQATYLQEIYSLCEADRIFWYSLFDQPPGHKTDNEANRPNNPPHDPRADGLGLVSHEGHLKQAFFEWLDLKKSETFLP